jgi:hypothetical protein
MLLNIVKINRIYRGGEVKEYGYRLGVVYGLMINQLVNIVCYFGFIKLQTFIMYYTLIIVNLLVDYFIINNKIIYILL